MMQRWGQLSHILKHFQVYGMLLLFVVNICINKKQHLLIMEREKHVPCMFSLRGKWLSLMAICHGNCHNSSLQKVEKNQPCLLKHFINLMLEGLQETSSAMVREAGGAGAVTQGSAAAAASSTLPEAAQVACISHSTQVHAH